MGRFITFSNGEGASVVIAHLTIRNCGGHSDGKGAILVTGTATPKIENCIFENNVVETGTSPSGAVFVAEGDASPTFVNCIFRDNRVKLMTGITGVSKGGVGSVIGGATATLRGCTLLRNRADLGGAIYVQGCLSVQSEGTSCLSSRSSTARPLGGVTLIDVTADSNRADDSGGLVYAKVGASITTRRLTARLNRATNSGGGVWLDDKAEVTVEDSTFDLNEAANGAALYVSDSTSVVRDSTFTNGTASSSGAGALLAKGAHATFTNSLFTRNLAASGGAIAVSSAASGSLTHGAWTDVTVSDGCTFTNNTADMSGGAIDVLGVPRLRCWLRSESRSLTLAQMLRRPGVAAPLR